MANNWTSVLNSNMDVSAPLVPIEEPPCKGCNFWKPHAVFNSNHNTGKIEQTGIRCCLAETMYRDFSCYVPRKEAGQKA
ncbi:MAG TPA: hypothetical protein VHO70_19815 [Chitinispirillaceae bacterium]|nr:hypothetical protein [Chitinispirillaceae bacterium]